MKLSVSRFAPLAAALALAASAQISAQDRPLSAPAPEAARGTSYGVDWNQTIAFQGDNHGAEITRETRFRVTLTDAARTGATTRYTVRVDSARGSASTPHSREVLDLRRLMGMTLTATSADTGRPVTWQAPAPDADFGDMGGPIPLASIIDPIFAAVPARVVRAGESWDRQFTRRSFDGPNQVTHRVRARFTVDRIEGRGADRVTHIRIAVTPDGAGAPQDFTASGTMVVGANGVLREFSLEEKSRGTWEFNGNSMPFLQTDLIRVTPRAR